LKIINSDYIIDNGNIINIHTGEVIEDNELLKSLLKEYNKNTREIKATIKNKGDIKDLKDVTVFNFNNKKRFIKLFVVESREIMDIKNLHKNSLLLFYALIPHLQWYTNKIKIQGASPTNDTLIELTNLNKNTLPKALKELSDKGIIKRIGNGANREIYFNPYIAFNGQHINKNTYDLFISTTNKG